MYSPSRVGALHLRAALRLLSRWLAVIGMIPALSEASGLTLKDETRPLWTRSSERFLRNWQVLADIPLPPAADAFSQDPVDSDGGEALIHPATSPRIAGTERQWRNVSSWGDAIDFSDGHGPKQNLVGYAYATVTRSNAGPARICVGSDESVRVWVNGQPVHEHRGPRQLNYDEDQIEVNLAAGDNAILVKLEQRSGPWQFALRVLESGAIPPRMQEIQPRLVEAAPSVLELRTDLSDARADESPVRVTAVAPGGDTLAEQSVLRGATVHFDASLWPEGPYEIRFETRALDGGIRALHLPWYKGDSLRAARAALDSAAVSNADTPEGATTRMLAAMISDRLGGSLENFDGNPWWAIHSPLFELAERRREQAGQKNARARPYGFVRLAWTDPVDGSTQYCRAYLPPGYDVSKSWPLVIRLHGRHPTNPEYHQWWSADLRHLIADSEYGQNQGVIYLEPHGRGNTMYVGLGDQDVMHALKSAQAMFNVDRNRIYLCGDSMGGFGTWNVATRHPDVFAAIAPMYGGVDFHSYLTHEQLAALPPLERFLQDKLSSWSTADSLRDLPILVLHGDADPVVPTEFSRYGVRLLERWGYNVRYLEMPGYAHEDLDQWRNLIDWFLQQRRKESPRNVRIRSAELQHAAAYWARVDQADRPDRFMTLDAELIGKNLVRLDTENVRAVTLMPDTPPIDPARPLKVVWNGRVVDAPQTGEREFQVSAPGYSRTLQPQKTARVAGPLGDVLNTPFVVVVGTSSSDAAMNAACRKVADALRADWQEWQHHAPRVVKDTDLSEPDAARYSLILVGDARANSVAQKIHRQHTATGLPLDLGTQAKGIRVGDRLIEGADLRVQAISPSPFSSERYVVLIGSSSAAGLAKWAPHELRNAEFDFVVGDQKTTAMPGLLTAATGWRARGWFDSQWQPDARLVFETVDPRAPR